LKQLEIGEKNHNIDTYIICAELAFKFKKTIPNEEFEKLNYN